MYIKVHVVPKSKKESIDKMSDDSYKICVKAEAKNNAVNKRLIEIVRELYPQYKIIKMVSGHRSPSKIFSLDV